MNILLVEGAEDQHVFWNLLEQHGFPERFTVKAAGGIEKLLESLPTHLKESTLERLGIVVDADDDPQGRWDGVLAKLPAHTLPTSCQPGGAIGTVSLVDRDVQVGLWVMPDCQQPGTLEDFFATLTPAADVLWPRAAAGVDAIPETERRFRVSYRMKAIVHTWLAWQENPGVRMGVSIKAGYVDAQADAARPLFAWLSRLFL